MKILLLYFSGTGNTKYISYTLKKAFEDEEVKVYISSIEEENINYDVDIIGIGYPVYAFNAPKVLEVFLRKVDFNCKDYFIYKTSGEPLSLNNSSSRQIKKIMRKKKCEFKGEYHLMMPYNILFKSPDEFVEEILYYNDLYVSYIARCIKGNRVNKIKESFLSVLICYLFKIQRPGARINSALYKVDKKKCINCHKCILNCPMNNIKKVNDKFVFGKHCQMCMRCSFNCPKDAIKIGLLNRWKVNGKYCFSKKDNNNFIENNYDKRFYRYFKKYINILNEKIKEN